LDPLPDRYDFLATINNKAIEYLSAGLPVISCPQKGVLFDLLKENQCGLSYEHGDAVGLSCLLGQLDRDRKTVAQMSRNAALLFEERFVAEKVYEQMACSIENIASLNHPLKDQDRENDDREPKNKRQSEGGLAPGIVYKRSWPVRMAKSILYISHNVMPQSAYQAMYGFGRRVLWAHQRLAYRIRFLIAKSFCQGETLERLRLVDLLLPFTMGGPLALESTFDIVSKAEKEGIPGALVECGVAKGGCSAMMALTSRYFGARRKLWLFDSYEGLPDPTVDDFKGEKAGEIIGPLAKGMLVGTVEQVKDLMFNKCSVSEDEVHLVKGWFQDTVPGTKDRVGKIAVLRLDGDWYESTKCCLENLYDSVTEGGYLIIDDYGTCFGCKRAVDEFLIKRRLRADLVPDGRGGVWFQKTA
jgi:O-methyltransferase